MLANDFIAQAANNDNIKNGGGDRRFCAGNEKRSRKTALPPVPAGIGNRTQQNKNFVAFGVGLCYHMNTDRRVWRFPEVLTPFGRFQRLFRRSLCPVILSCYFSFNFLLFSMKRNSLHFSAMFLSFFLFHNPTSFHLCSVCLIE